MKYVIIGLGNFGASLAEELTKIGHEVIGVDHNMGKVEMVKESITHSICLDSTDEQAVKQLPLKDADAVLVCIGEDEGSNLMTTALMKRIGVKKLISRAITPLHQTVLEAMQVDEIVHPEQETATRWAKRLNIDCVVDSFELTGEYSIVEATVPERLIGKTLIDVGFHQHYNLIVLTTIATEEVKNALGVSKKVTKVQGVASPKTELKEGDIMVLYGHINDIERFLEE